MKKFTLLAILLLKFLTTEAKWPDILKRCHRHDPNINDCLSDAILDAIKTLNSPILQEFGLPSLEPLKVRNVAFEVDIGGTPTDVVYPYYEVHGITKNIQQPIVTMDFDTHTLRIKFPFTSLSFTFRCIYNSSVVSGNGSGRSNSTNHQYDVTFRLREELYHNGQIHYQVLDTTIKLDSEKTEYDIYEFEGNVSAEELTKLLNENVEVVVQDTNHEHELTAAGDFHEWLQTFLSKVTIPEFFGEEDK